MTWNYRICKRTYLSEDALEVHEVYYNPDGSIWAVTEEPVTAFGETLKELRSSLRRMQEATKKEVVDLDTLVFAPHHVDKLD